MAKILLALLTLALCQIPIHGFMRVDFPRVLSKENREYLEAHNEERARVRVEPLIWSRSLANAASRLIRAQKSCNFVNISAVQAAQYGGNQLRASVPSKPPRSVVDVWVREKIYYNYTDNSCAPYRMCGLYTQVVWRESRHLGCSQEICGKYNDSLTVCLYSPPGNYLGQKPY